MVAARSLFLLTIHGYVQLVMGLVVMTMDASAATTTRRARTCNPGCGCGEGWQICLTTPLPHPTTAFVGKSAQSGPFADC